MIFYSVAYDPQGPLRFIRIHNGPQRGLGHFRMEWDDSIHDQVGETTCVNGGRGTACPSLGIIRHKGRRFSNGLPVTATGDIVGPVGGFGWILDLDAGPPREIRFDLIEVLPETPLMLSIPYPPGTSFTLTAHAAWCSEDGGQFSCSETFRPVGSIEQVRNGPGNLYHVDDQGVITFRIVQTAQNFVGRPAWFLPTRDDLGRYGDGYATSRFARAGVYLPSVAYGPHLLLQADNCGGSGTYCTNTAPAYNPDICPSSYTQLAYDRCCRVDNSLECIYANGEHGLVTESSVASGARRGASALLLVLAGMSVALLLV